MQEIFDIDYSKALKLTTARYYTPSGRCIQKINYSKNANNKKLANTAIKQKIGDNSQWIAEEKNVSIPVDKLQSVLNFVLEQAEIPADTSEKYFILKMVERSTNKTAYVQMC